MEKITEDYCSYEIAKLLEEKGFDWPCHGSYHIEYPKNKIVWSPKPVNDDGQIFMNAPTHQMAMKWLRENKGLFINIGQSKCMNAPIKYRFSIWKDVTYIGKSGDTGDYSTYEEAVEAALKYCLTKLI